MKLDKQFLRHLLLYGLIGSLSAGLDMAIFYVLHTRLSMNEYLANIISIHCGILVSFTLNSRINFRKTDKLLRRGLTFYATGLGGLALSSLILYIGSLLGLPINLVKLFSVFFVAGVQFIVNKFITFRR